MNILQRAFKAFFWLLLRMLYRVRSRGLRNIPKGAAVLVPNHVSYIDALLIAAHIGRPIRFAMYWRIYDKLKWIVAPMGAFPISSPTENRKVFAAAFDTMAAALDAGELVCIFPEGMLTTTGEMNPFRKGVIKVLERNPVPVLPVGLRGIWGSYFSRKKPGIFKMPDHFMAKIEMVVGEPLPPSVDLDVMQETVRALAYE